MELARPALWLELEPKPRPKRFSFNKNLKNGILYRRPESWIAKRIIMMPPIISSALLWITRNWPSDPITAPNVMKTMENPRVKRTAWRRVVLFCLLWPLMNAKYPGMIGRIHGENTDTIPARNATIMVGCMP